jgi:hypothetical protein
MTKRMHDLIRAISDINMIVHKPFTDAEIAAFAEFIDRKFPDKTPEDVVTIIDLYITGKMKWNDFDKMRNITIPLVQVHFIECLEGFYEKLPGNIYRYRGYERNEMEWQSFLYERWFEYRRIYSHSADVIWTQMVSGIRTMMKEIGAKADDKFSYWDEFVALNEICKTKD